MAQDAQEQPGSGTGTLTFEGPASRPFYIRTLKWWSSFLRRKPLGAFGIVVILIMVICALFADVLGRYPTGQSFRQENPAFDEELYQQSLTDPMIRLQHPPETFERGSVLKANASPDSENWLGTDHRGRDLYTRIIYGAQVSLYVGIGASLLAVVVGTTLGVISAYFGGKVDIVMQRFVDALQAFPALILLLLIIQVLERPTIHFIVLALGIVGLAPVIRIVRSAVLSQRENVYVLAATTIGASETRIMARHILPNIFAPIIVIFSASISVYILAEAGLSFLGFGDPTVISWGRMVDQGRQQGTAAPLFALFSGLAITFSVLGFSLFGDALRDALDPRLRGAGGRTSF